jgi:hypothetical protein
MKIKQQEEKSILEKRICDLVSAVEFFINQAEEMNNIYKKVNTNFASLHSVIYFSQVLNIFRTLFEKTLNRTQEQSFEKWRKMQNTISKEELDFQKIIDLYDQSNFKKFRDKITNHKDYNNAGDILANFLNPVDDVHLRSAKKIIKIIKSHIREYFDEDNIEYNFNAYYQKKGGAEYFMSNLKSRYEK